MNPNNVLLPCQLWQKAGSLLQPSHHAHFMIAAQGFAFGRQFLALHLHYFRSLSSWPEQAAGLNYLEDVMVAFLAQPPAGNRAGKATPASHKRFCAQGCAGMLLLLMNITLPKKSLFPPAILHCAAPARCLLTGGRHGKKVKPGHFCHSLR